MCAERALVLIGVGRTGGLPELQAVEPGLQTMRTWARTQSFAEERIVSLSDADGSRVDVARVYDAVAGLVAQPTLEQLIVYFAGHGVNNGQSEFWLLSGAPTNPNEAVNVAASALFAERCGVPHVVLISDACRTAPAGVQALAVMGASIFPNVPPPAGPGGSVDQFFACLLGDPAHEIADPQQSARAYRSVYTDVLGEALIGRHPDLLTHVGEGAEAVDVVRPWTLARGLPDLVTRRLQQLGVLLSVSQTPVARLTSDPDRAWLARLRPGPPTIRLPEGTHLLAAGPGAAAVAARGMVRTELRLQHGTLTARPKQARKVGDPARVPRPAEDEGERLVRLAADALAVPFGPTWLDSDAGFTLRGAELREVSCAGGGARSQPGGVVTVDIAGTGPAALAVLRFGEARCIVLPALLGYLGAITCDGSQVVDVRYEPMGASSDEERHGEAVDAVRRRHAVVAAAFRFGVLSLDAEEAETLAHHAARDAALDPTLALYAAYACHDLGRRDWIARLRAALLDAVGVDFFDLPLLAAEGPGGSPRHAPLLPPVPLLSRGWALVSAGGAAPVGLPERPPSLWTVFRAEEGERVLETVTKRRPA